MNKFQFIELFAVPNRVTPKGVTAIAAPKSRIARGGNPAAERMIATSRAGPQMRYSRFPFSMVMVWICSTVSPRISASFSAIR